MPTGIALSECGEDMTIETMTRRASDNEYLHKDFHGALSAGVEYLDRTFGEESVRSYLRGFALSFYAPVREALWSRGLVALKEHFEGIYEIEQSAIRMEISEDELVMHVEACPAVTHMRERGYAVARLFGETDAAVNAALCEGTPFAYEMLEYDPQIGRSRQRFYRRPR